MLKKTIFKAICLTLLATNAQALELCGEKTQGEIIKGFASEKCNIFFNDKEIPVSKDGEFIIALGRDDSLNKFITINGTKHPFTIAKQKWDIQNIKGLPQKTVTPSKKDLKDINRETSEIRGAQKESASDTYWKKGFVEPVQGRISGRFGGQRIMNGKPKNPHMGTDIAAIEGTPIKASSDGVVALTGYDYFYSGNVVLIDHGYGLFTIYAHMKDIHIKTGDTIKQNDIIGTVGKTGRATGAHLHWGASLNGVRFDPYSLLKLNSNKYCFTL